MKIAGENLVWVLLPCSSAEVCHSVICQKNSLEKQNLSFSWIFMQSNLNIHISGLAGLCNIMMAFIHTYICVRIPELILHYWLKGIMFKIVVTLNRSNNNILKFLYPHFQHTSIVIVSSVIWKYLLLKVHKFRFYISKFSAHFLHFLCFCSCSKQDFFILWQLLCLPVLHLHFVIVKTRMTIWRF